MTTDLPAYIERQLAATLERLGITADSAEGRDERERAAERHRAKLQSARLRRAAKKAPAKPAAEPAAEDEKKEGPSSPSVTLLSMKPKQRVKASAKLPEDPEGSCEPTSEPAALKPSQKRGRRSAKASLAVISPSTG